VEPSQVTLSTLFEGAPRFVARLAGEHANSWDELFGRAERIALDMPENEQIELLNAHPRIGARPASLSAMSFREQGYDRDRPYDLDPGTAALQERLDLLNEAYEARFGFRFVVFVDGRSRDAIADVMQTNLSADREQEKERCLRDVVAIARSRLARTIEEQPV
jgi:2-oxo-4-hydroxy-4-carboxy--5-ureidoimidazoline (OHCU) decarboxylase